MSRIEDIPNSPYMTGNIEGYSKELSCLLSISTSQELQQNQVVYLHGDESKGLFYFVESGRVKHSVFDEGGSEKILTIQEKNTFFGYTAALDGYPHFATVTTLEKTKLRIIKIKDFFALVERYPKISFMMMKAYARVLRAYMFHIQDSSFLDAQKRVAHILCKLANEIGQKTPRGMLISKKMTHNDIANITGLSRVSVSLALNYLENLDILRKKRYKIEILDMERLKNLVPS